jgi:hypothetical protein
MYLEDVEKNNNITNKVNTIFSTIKLFDLKNENIKKKINKINDIYIQYEFNRNLDLDNTSSYLKFQVELLQNEINYYNNIKKIFIKKFSDDLYNISENIILILISINDLDIGYNEEKNNIMNHILKIVKKKNNINIIKLEGLIKITFNNLKLVKDFIDLFEKFILKTEDENIKNNIHSKKLKINLMNKKNNLNNEYNKYYDELMEFITYFNDLSNNIQLNRQEIYKFLMDNKDI